MATGVSQKGESTTLWSGAEDGATISPDGKLIAHIDWSSGDVAIRDVATGTTTALTDRGIFAGSAGFPEPFLVFSPQSDLIAYPFGNSEAGEPFRYELRLAGIDSTAHKVLAVYPSDVEFVAPLDWHSAIGILFTTVAADGSNELLMMQPEGRTIRIVERRQPGAGIVTRGLITPDGTSVLYLAHGSIQSVPSTGGIARPIGIDAEALLGITTDGRGIIFHATRGGITGNWSARIEGGQATGNPTLELATDQGVLAAGQTLAGTAYLEPASVPRLFAVSLDPGSARVHGTPAFVALTSDSVPGNPAWSRDGARFAFTLRAPNRSTHSIMVSNGLHGPAKEVARVDLRVMGLDWSADGKFLIVGGRAATRQLAWVGRVEVATGRVERLVSAPVNAVAAAGRGVVYVRAAAAGERLARVTFLPEPGATPRVLATYGAAELPRTMSVSPDGKWVALVKSVLERRATVVMLLPIEGGDPRVVLEIARPDALELNLGAVPWTTDGRSVLVILRRQGERRFAAVDIESGRVTPIPFAPRQGGRRQPALHPGGRQLVYVDGAERNDLKLMEHR